MKRFAILILLLASSAFGQEPVKEERGMGYVPLTPEKRKMYQAISEAKHGARLTMMAKNQALPAAYDVRSKIPLPVGDQGQCGSCYLYATVRQMTSLYVGLGYGKADNSLLLSVQYGMDRPRDFGGCNGGNGTEVVAWACKNGWIAEKYIDTDSLATIHNDYPAYEARSGNDRTKAGAKKWMIGTDWGFVNANGRPTVEEIKAALVNYGRLNIALDAGGQFGSGAGTITSLGSSINHEILCVGYDDAKQAFLLENQWSSAWGDGGYRWITYNAARGIVDWFYLIGTPLPPPPVPPTPIPPVPPAAGVNLSPGTSFFIEGVRFNVPSGGTITWPADTPQWLKDAVEKNKKTEPKMPPVKNEPGIVLPTDPPQKLPMSELKLLRENQERMLTLIEAYSARLKRLEDAIGATSKAPAVVAPKQPAMQPQPAVPYLSALEAVRTGRHMEYLEQQQKVGAK